MFLKDYSNSYIQECVLNYKNRAVSLPEKVFNSKKKMSMNDIWSVRERNMRHEKIFSFWGGFVSEFL